MCDVFHWWKRQLATRDIRGTKEHGSKRKTVCKWPRRWLVTSPDAILTNAFVESRGRHEEAAFADRRLLLLLLLSFSCSCSCYRCIKRFVADCWCIRSARQPDEMRVTGRCQHNSGHPLLPGIWWWPARDIRCLQSWYIISTGLLCSFSLLSGV